MMWGSRLTTAKLEQVLTEIAETAKKVFPDIEEIGIEFGQKIHLLCYDIANEKIREDTLRDFFTDDETCDLTDEERYCLSKDVLRAKKIASILQDSKFDGKKLPKLTLLGFSGRGSLKKRIDFCKILKKTKYQKDVEDLKPRYFLIHQWYEEAGYYKNLAKEASDSLGVPLAFHPFRFGPSDKRDQIDDLLKAIDKELDDANVRQVQFVPDTAHLWLANMMTFRCDPDAFKWIFEDKLNRITVFHLKDWKKTFDSSLQYFSSGFTALGGGDLSKYADGIKVETPCKSDLGKFCRKFRIWNADSDWRGVETERWVVFEQDFTIANEKDTLQQSLEWFRDIVSDKPVAPPPEGRLPATLRRENVTRETKNEGVRKDGQSEEFEYQKRQIINELHYLASDNTEQFVTVLQDLCRYLFYGERKSERADEDTKDRPVHIALWEMSPRISTMVLLNKNEIIVAGEPVNRLVAKRSYRITNDACTGFRIWELSDGGNQNEECKAFFDAYCTTPEQLKERWKSLSEEEKGTVSDTVVSIPLCNTYNHNQIEARLDIFVNRQKLPRFSEVLQGTDGAEEESEGLFREDYLHKLENYLDDLVQNIGFALEKVWSNTAYQTSSDLIDKVRKEDKNSGVMLKKLMKNQNSVAMLNKLMEDQNSVAMLNMLIDELKDHFVLDSCFYYELSKEDATLCVYAPWLSLEDITDEFFECRKGDPGYQSLKYCDFWIGDDQEQKYSWMTFPVYDPTSREKDQDTPSAEVLGIIRCLRTNERSFTASDESTVHKMLADFVPLFLIRHVSERRMRSIRLIRHELKSPLRALERAVQKIVEEITKNQAENQWTFSDNKDYVKEITRYVKIKDSVLDNSSFLTGKEVMMHFSNKPVPLIKDVVMPAINQGLCVQFSDTEEESGMHKKISVFCNGYKNSDFSYDEMRWHDILRQGPALLYIDVERILQVFFNLLINAIKYRPEHSNGGIEIYLNSLPYGDKKLVKREKMGPEGYEPDYDQKEWAVEILFCNEGLGIPEKCNKLIFDENFRASNVINDFQGDGLGLWVCRKILRAHKSEISLVWNGGSVTPGKPTMFRILLNKSLKEPHQEIVAK